VAMDRTEASTADRLQLVFVGLQAWETVSWEFSGPGSCRGGSARRADELGFSSYFFGLQPSSQASCAGSWTVSAIGDQGTTSTAVFTFVHS
jgi:hypothetical protein